MSETQETTPSKEAEAPVPPVEDVKAAIITSTSEEDTKAADEPKEDEKKEETKAEPVVLTSEDFTLPDGMVANEPLQKEFLEIMNKDMDAKERTQALIDLQGKTNQEALETARNVWKELQDKWTEEVKADPDIGGDKLEATQTVIAKSLEEFGNKDVREAFVLTGAGNNPHIVRYIHKMAVALGEGKPVSGTPSTVEASQAETLFPNQGA